MDIGNIVLIVIFMGLSDVILSLLWKKSPDLFDSIRNKTVKWHGNFIVQIIVFLLLSTPFISLGFYFNIGKVWLAAISGLIYAITSIVFRKERN
ncbi:MAG: hypothetical protein GXZ08_00250 [Tissierellia bacterium]|nr:hypothetical protein [Tissierellia bacterium]